MYAKFQYNPACLRLFNLNYISMVDWQLTDTFEFPTTNWGYPLVSSPLDQLIVLATDLLQQVLRGDGFQHILLAGLLQLPAQHQLVQDEVCLLEIEDYVQLANLTVGMDN